MTMKAWMAAAAVGACGVSAWAQQDASGMEVVEGGTVDENPMSEPMRLVPMDMRVPTAFERVYRVETQTGDLFARQDGGLTAVFPRSVYEFGPRGVTTPVPAGTTWLIGDMPWWYAQSQGLISTGSGGGGPAPVNPLRVDLRADTGAGDERMGGGRAPVVDLVGAWPSREDSLLGPISRDARGPDEATGGEDVDALLAASAPVRTEGVMPWGSDEERGRTVALLLAQAAAAARGDEAGEEQGDGAH